MVSAVMFSSATENWATPTDLFDELNKEFTFTLDAAAAEWNHKVANYFTKDQDALTQEWNGTVWLNPPYGRTIGLWVEKAYKAAGGGATVVMLLPARTDTRWFHDYAIKGELRFIKGRIKFVDEAGNNNNPAPFPSMLVIFRGSNGRMA